MTREEQIETIEQVLAEESFAVFAFAGDPGASPYSSVMFFAAMPDLRLVFGTSPGAFKGRYLTPRNGACVQIDNRQVGLENMSQFARVTVQGFLRRAEDPAEIETLHGVYFGKLPHAKVFFQRPGVETWIVEPSHLVFSRGMGERFELDFPESAA